MTSKRVRAAVLSITAWGALLLVVAPAYAVTAPTPPPEDNGRWVGPIAFVVFVALVGGMLFIANAYRKNNK